MEECKKSQTSKHEWVYPRMEDSIDKKREATLPYCKYCFIKLTKEMEKKSFLENQNRTPLMWWY